MTNLRSQKNMAAKLLKCGISRVWIDPKKIKEVSEAITNADVRKLIRDGVIKAKQKKGVSRGRKKKLAAQKRKGRRKGPGSRKGKANAILSRKRSWIIRIRTLRVVLKSLRNQGLIKKSVYRDLYLKAKGGFFRNRSYLISYLEREGLVSKDDLKKFMKPKKEKEKSIKRLSL